MRKIIKNVLKAILCAVPILVLAGCSLWQQAGNTYGPYVKSVMDTALKGETAEYLEYTNDSEEGAEEYYQMVIDTFVDDFLDEYSIEIVDDEDDVRMNNIMKQILAQAEYEVDDAVKTSDYYTVQVTITPIDLSSTISSDFITFGEDLIARYEAGEFNDYEDATEAYNVWAKTYAEGVMDILENHLDDLVYADPIEKIVKIVEDDESYGVSDDDLASLIVSVVE
jgi:hypothetical protein